MSDNSVIARIYAWPRANDLATQTIRRSLFGVMPLQKPTMAARFGRLEHATTPVPDDSTDMLGGLQQDPYILISFDKLPRTSHGVVFGGDWESDVVLPDKAGISAFHFSISFDDQRRLIVKDLNSTTGTQVTFGAQGLGFRRHFQWLVGGLNDVGSAQIIIRVSNGLSFCLVPEKHDTSRGEYAVKVDAFRRAAGIAPRFNTFNARVQSQLELPRGTRAPHVAEDGPIHLKKLLGSGGNGRASYLWNVSTGEEMVVKEPICVCQADQASWKQEAHAMRALCHESILKLIDAEFTPKPRLFLEYCPGGTLAGIANQLSAGEILEVLQQSLAGLSYFHNMGIAHRDLKPGNIFVASRSPLKIKLADLGLSKSEGMLKSGCGTDPFMAPEIWDCVYSTQQKYYTKAVDIWALGVVIYELLFDRSRIDSIGYPSYSGQSHCVNLVRQLNGYLKDNRGTIAEFVAQHMLQLQPGMRASAALCYSLAMALPAPNDRVRGSRNIWRCAATSSATDGCGDNDTTTIFLGVATGDSGHTVSAGYSTSDSYQEDTQGQSRKRTASDSQSSDFESQPRKRHLSDSQYRASVFGGRTTVRIRPPTPTPTSDENWTSSVSWTEGDAAMEDFTSEEY